MLVIETKEVCSEEALKTHYYKTSYLKLKETVINYFQRKNFHILSIDDNYSEISAEKPHFMVQVKIIEQNPKETSIDFYINSEFLFGNKKKVYAFLEEINQVLSKEHELKGLGLHP